MLIFSQSFYFIILITTPMYTFTKTDNILLSFALNIKEILEEINTINENLKYLS